MRNFLSTKDVANINALVQQALQ
ncbi:MAG: hypothetical protein RIR90_1169, partial [Bacteroidota bacterium]